MNTDFPENLFPPVSHRHLYDYKVEYGEKICKTKSILFCGIVRDAASVLDRNIQCLHRTGSFFKEYEIFIYENNSKDNTLEILEKNKSDKLIYLSEKRNDHDYLSHIESGEDMWHYNRCKVLSECRNKYLYFIEQRNKKYDYICVIDLDLKGAWSYDGIKHGVFTLENNEYNGAVTAYGILADKFGKLKLEDSSMNNYVMYDSFAFRPKNWKLGLHLLSTPAFNGIQLNRNDSPFEVESNFGGLAIYKNKALLKKKYGSKQWATGYVDPDHVVLHRHMIMDGWKIIIDPSMIASYSHHKYSLG